MTGQRQAARRSVLAGAAAFAAVGAYVVTTVVGGAATPGYSHLSLPISELTSSYAPHRAALACGYAGYNAALAVLAIALWRRSRPSATAWAAYALLSGTALAGVLMVGPFPQDSTGTPLTAAGSVHIVLAAFASLAIVVAAALLGIAWRRDPRWRGLARFSLAAAAALLVTAPAGFALVGSTDYFGLVERVVIGIVLVWVAGIGGYALRREPGDVSAPTARSETSTVSP